MLYVIIVYAFNNQIRFNSNGEFNLPVGKRDFNKKMEQKLIDFIDKIQEQNCIFTCRDFREFDTSKLTSKDFVYVDPPYLITCATYNEQGGWSEEDEKDLLSFLDELNDRNIRFALSKDVYMAKLANITSIWANYPKEKNNYYDLLVDITSWTEDDFIREKELKKQYISFGIKPDYTISKFSQLLPIILQEK